ncbi:MAG: VTT domain-containing protein [Halobacteriales archaeon]|nr:VTT domain-containing protein [Halobacteriales archaeon]
MQPRRWQLGAGLLVAALVIVGVVVPPGAVLDRLRRILLSPYFPAILIGLYLVRPLLAWPITALSVLVGYRYGVILGLPLALLGAVATSLLPYLVARRIGFGDGLAGRLQAGSRRFFTATGDLRGVIAARLAPTPAEAISAAAGAGGVSVPMFIIGTAIGELPWTIAAVLAGDSMHRLSMNAAATPDLRLGAAAGLVAVLLLAGPCYRWYRRRTDQRPTGS